LITENKDYYTFQKSRSGEIVPLIEGHPLHSSIDPKREAQRLVSTIKPETGFLIFFGLGGGFFPEAALEQTDANVIVIDYNQKGISELFSSIDLTHLIKNERFSFLNCPSGEEIKSFILENYKPALFGGIRVIPLRPRVETDKLLFDAAAASMQAAIDIVSGDYTVQSHFGKRWFNNIIRNIKQLAVSSEQVTENNERVVKNKTPVKEAAIIAAGPSLDLQLQEIKELKARNGFIISTDTALPVLAHNKIIPDAVVSIDCQHISYYHFLYCSFSAKKHRNNPGSIPLFIDIASPPQLSRLKGFSPVFFSSDHPLARYFSRDLLPFLDTSGANVTYACLSAAEYFGAKRIHLFGADFSYINSQSYARGTYIYPYFYKRQNRLSPIEAQFSKFLYRSPFLTKNSGQKTIKSELLTKSREQYYETASLRFYREKFEEKASLMDAEIICAKGMGAPVSICREQVAGSNDQLAEKDEQRIKKYCVEFLESYRKDIMALPEAEGKSNYFNKLNEKERQVFTTLLPYLAAVRKREPELTLKDLIQEVKRRCTAEIERVTGG